MDDALLGSLRQAEDSLASVFRMLGAFPALSDAAVRRDLAAAIVHLHGLRRACEAGASESLLPAHAVWLCERILKDTELSVPCGAD